jgi:hypothetical protein
MKPFKLGLRIWITVSSVLIFLTSWVIFGHSPKPISLQAYVTPLPTLEPLPPIPGSDNAQKSSGFSFFSLFNQPPRQRSRSMFVTGGS